MLRIFICPQCYNFRMVSRKKGAICFHCGVALEKTELNYSVYINMSLQERDDYREKYKKRMKHYYDELNGLFQKNSLKISSKESLLNKSL